ncbi:MAG: ATPase [Clostridiales bacterium]|nr:ATPase [Clostridiales bacterium]
MGASKIEQIIDEIYDFVDGCKSKAFSVNQIVVPRDEMYDLLDELRLRTPDEIKRYQKIIAQRDAILAAAQEEADQMIEEAQQRMNALVDEHEIMQQAYAHANEVMEDAANQANEMLSQAQRDADEIRSGALSYADSLMENIQDLLTQAHEASKMQYEAVIGCLKDNLDVVVANRKELTSTSAEDPDAAIEPEENENMGAAAATEEENEDVDFVFDANTTLEDLDSDE